ncbi:MAG TPA: class I SAM-dependent methyltransferase [Anaerolineales bacterium]|jgi:SAM-dependent methyltransferase|nr:class I SAM-dependent methyltransferase [Anaerolineales bacterium]
MKQPEIWHHGLVARDWAEFATEGGQEATYFKSLIERSGQPALDLGCGTGRLLLPYLQAGLHVDGVDYSRDMLEQCRQRAERDGLSPELYQQAMHELDLPRRYKTIYACGVIGLGGERRPTIQAIRRCYEHLRPGGTFAFDLTARWNDRPAYLSRLPENRHFLPDEWPSSTERKLLADGTELEIAARTVSVDPLEETQTRQLRARLWRNGELLEEQVHTQRYEEYGKNELLLVLERAGFSDVQIFGDYSDEPATADHKELIFVAQK